MELLIYFMVSVACFLGIIAGISLAFIAPEELKPGRKYFAMLQKLFLALILFFLLYRYHLSLYLLIPICLIFLCIMIFLDKKKNMLGHYLVYLPLAVIYHSASASSDSIFFPLLSSFIFLYSIPTGTLLAHNNAVIKNIKNYDKITNKTQVLTKAIPYLIFIAAALFLWVVF